jgi:magnesium-transporting ATPase (P-type)
MGRIANLASDVGFHSTTLAKEMQHFVNIVIGIAVTMGLIFFIIILVLGNSWLVAISFLIGIIAANVPEGLLSTICVSLITLLTVTYRFDLLRNYSIEC